MFVYTIDKRVIGSLCMLFGSPEELVVTELGDGAWERARDKRRREMRRQIRGVWLWTVPSSICC